MTKWLKFYYLLTLVLLSVNAEAQKTEIEVKIEGLVIDAATKLPVEASISYESLPYGSRVGLFSGSKFEFRLYECAQYILYITAEGFVPYQEILNITPLSAPVITKTIALQSGRHNIISLNQLTFDLGQANLKPESKEELDKLVYLFRYNKNLIIQLEGHSDFRGSAKHNMNLSKRRVYEVKNYLIQRGINKKQIKTEAFGGSQPLSQREEADMKRINRRVDVKVLNDPGITKR